MAQIELIHFRAKYLLALLSGILSPGVKARPGRDSDHSPPSSAEVVNE
jgi:hypothetical protein